jgi:predicted PurR-regulated permease PerM
MSNETENVSAPLDTTAIEAQRLAWPVPLLVGLVIGVVASVISALLRRQPALKGQVAGTISALWSRQPAPEGQFGAVLDEPAPALALAAEDAGPVAAIAQKAPLPAGGQPAWGVQPEEPGLQPPGLGSPWREPAKYIVGVGLFLAGLAILWLSRSVISTVIVAALLTMIVQPFIRFLQRRLKLRQGLAIALIYLLIVAMMVLIPLLVIPSLIETINDLTSVDYQALAETVASRLEAISAQVSQIPVLNALLTPFLDSVASVLEGIPPPGTAEPVTVEQAMGGIVERLAQILGVVANILGPVVSAVVALVFMLLISLHLSLSGRRLLSGYPRLIPPAYQLEIVGLVHRIQQVWLSFLRGQFTLMVMIGVIVWLGNALLGNRNALLLGFISGLLEIIPNLGPALALIPGVLMALLFGSSHFDMSPPAFAVIVLIFYLLVQLVENQLIVPYVLGGQLEVPALVVIIGVMVGGSVAGILGILLAVPIIATGREVFMYLYAKILQLPEAEPPPKKPSILDAARNRLRSVKLPFGRHRGRAPLPEQMLSPEQTPPSEQTPAPKQAAASVP